MSQVAGSDSEERSSSNFHQYMANYFIAPEAAKCASSYICASREEIQRDCADTDVRRVKGPIHSKLNCVV